MLDSKSPLFDKSLLLVFAYAPAGFGHLRVTDALHHGLPEEITPILLGSQDETIRWQHRFMSIHPLTRRLMVHYQEGKPEILFTKIYRWILRHRTKTIYTQMINLIEEQYEVPATILIVATHFGLAHQLGAIKKKLEEAKKVRIILVVQVTDDSPQLLWYVPEADLMFTPSERTKNLLEAYGKKTFGKGPLIEVSSYPVSPVLAEKLPYWAFRKRQTQLQPTATVPINISIPLSGAAVGLDYLDLFIEKLSAFSQRFVFHIVARQTPYTLFFFNKMLDKPFVKLYVSKSDREVVHEYEKLYQQTVVALEISKPSEQSFKALLTPKQQGGAVMLFSQPVGKQENDNLAFMREHSLIPRGTDTEFLIKKALKDTPLTPGEKRVFWAQAARWRGLELPQDASQAAQLIYWLYKEEILFHMIGYKGPVIRKEEDRQELSPHGVADFWEKVSEFLVQDAKG